MVRGASEGRLGVWSPSGGPSSSETEGGSHQCS